MTDLRQAAQQALDALNLVSDEGESKFPATIQGAISDLEAALAQQAEPVEPVAWVRLEAWKSGKDWPDDCFTALPAEGLTPLCKCADTPPQRKPLTEEEAAALIELDPRILKEFGTAASGAAMELIRAVERAHGIGGQDDNANS